MQELDDYINKVQTLPPAPRILPQLLALLHQDNVNADRIVELITLDPGLTASVLRLSNSAYFACGAPVETVLESVQRLGFNQVYKLVVAVSGAHLLNGPQKGYGLNAGELWEHSITAAVAAQFIAQDRQEDENLAFTAALLHDLGKIVLAEALEHIYTRLIEENRSQQSALIETEKRLLGVQHAEIGGRLLARWKFPQKIVDAVWHHHQPEQAGSARRLAAQVYLGNMIAYFLGYGYGYEAFALRGRADALHLLELKPEALPQFMIRTLDKLHLLETLVGMKA